MANTVVDLSALTKYTDELAIELIPKAVLRGRSLDTGFTIQSDVKYKAALNIMNSTLIGQATDCGMSATGSVALSQRDLEVCPITVFEDLCLSKFEEYWTGKLMRPGSYNEQIPFEEIYTSDKIAKIQNLNEKLIWAGSKDGNDTLGTGAVTGNLTLCNGILNTLQFTSATSSVVNAGTTASFAKATSISIIDTIINKFTSDCTDALEMGDLNIYISYPNFNLLTQALRDANYYNFYTEGDEGSFRIDKYLGTNFNVIAVSGLNGSDRIVCTPAENIYYGTDLMNDWETFEVFYDRTEDTVYFRSKWKMGIQIAFPEFVVLYNG